MTYRIALLLACLALAGGAVADEVARASISMGGDVEITQPVEGPVFAAGGTVNVDAAVNGDVHAAGGKVRVGPDAVISGDVALAGGKINVDGSIKGELNAAGGKVRINAPVAGDTSVAAGTLELGPDARIGGKLTFHGQDLRRDPAAQVTSGVEHTQGRRWHRHERTAAERFAHGWIWTAGLMVLAALIAAALPGPSQRLAQELRERPWITLLVGFLAFTSIPIAAVLIMITIIGIPIGLLALIGYAALLLVGYVWLAVVVGGMLLDRVRPETAALTAWRVGAAVLTMLVLAILVRMPFVGGVFKLAAVAFGVGMIVAAVLHRSRPAEAPSATV
ncbi:MAG TPA: polymer-forming cytoskeletal protein [Usitatibacter sp.]|nr:polymer-forming cytoskeletal protein [Usitatibacter sp.]